MGTLNAPVLDDLRQQFDALKERKSMMPEGVRPLGEHNLEISSNNHRDRDCSLLLELHFVLHFWFTLAEKKIYIKSDCSLHDMAFTLNTSILKANLSSLLAHVTWLPVGFCWP